MTVDHMAYAVTEEFLVVGHPELMVMHTIPRLTLTA